MATTEEKMELLNTLHIKQIMGAYFAMVIAFYAPIAGLAIAICLAIALDTILGIWKNVKKNGWKEFSSRKLSQVVSKSILYLISIYLLFPIDHYIVNDIIKNLVLANVDYLATKLLALSIVFIEIKSIDENLKEMGVNVWANIKKIVHRAKEIKDDVKDITE